MQIFLKGHSKVKMIFLTLEGFVFFQVNIEAHRNRNLHILDLLLKLCKFSGNEQKFDRLQVENVSGRADVSQEISVSGSKKESARRTSSKKTLLKVFNGKAPGKRQIEFNKIFAADVPDDEPLIADFRFIYFNSIIKFLYYFLPRSQALHYSCVFSQFSSRID